MRRCRRAFSASSMPPTTQVVCDDGSQYGSQAPCDGTIARQFAEHLNAPSGRCRNSVRVRCVLDAAEPGDRPVGRVRRGRGRQRRWHSPGRLRLHVRHRRSRMWAAAISRKRRCCKVWRMGVLPAAVFLRMRWSASSARGFQTSGRSRTAGLGDFVNGAFPTELGCVGVQVNGAGSGAAGASLADCVCRTRLRSTRRCPNSLARDRWTSPCVLNPGLPNAVPERHGHVSIRWRRSRRRSSCSRIPPASPPRKPERVRLWRIPRRGGSFARQARRHRFALWHRVWRHQPCGCGWDNWRPEQRSLTNPDHGARSATYTLASSDVLYAGLSPGSISGLYQFNVRIPAVDAERRHSGDDLDRRRPDASLAQPLPSQ